MARAKLSAVQFGNEFDAGLSLRRQSWGFALWGLTRICAMNAEFATVVPHPAAGVMLARSRAAHRNELNSIPWLLLRFLEQARGRLQRRTRLMSNGTELAVASVPPMLPVPMIRISLHDPPAFSKAALLRLAVKPLAHRRQSRWWSHERRACLSHLRHAPPQSLSDDPSGQPWRPRATDRSCEKPPAQY